MTDPHATVRAWLRDRYPGATSETLDAFAECAPDATLDDFLAAFARRDEAERRETG